MKRMALSLAGIMVAASASALAADSQTYDLSGFTGVDISAGYKTIIEVGGAYSVRAETKDGDLSEMRLEVKGDTLIIGRKNKRAWNFSGKGPRTTVYVNMPTLSSLEASSGSDAMASGVTTDRLYVDVSSGADVDVEDVRAGDVTVEVSSGSDATLSGTCNEIEADSSSGARADARDLVCKTGSADASSGSSISIHVTESVTADASSGASVSVYGKPSSKDVDKSSGGSVRIK